MNNCLNCATPCVTENDLLGYLKRDEYLAGYTEEETTIIKKNLNIVDAFTTLSDGDVNSLIEQWIRAHIDNTTIIYENGLLKAVAQTLTIKPSEPELLISSFLVNPPSFTFTGDSTNISVTSADLEINKAANVKILQGLEVLYDLNLTKGSHHLILTNPFNKRYSDSQSITFVAKAVLDNEIASKSTNVTITKLEDTTPLEISTFTLNVPVSNTFENSTALKVTSGSVQVNKSGNISIMSPEGLTIWSGQVVQNVPQNFTLSTPYTKQISSTSTLTFTATLNANGKSLSKNFTVSFTKKEVAPPPPPVLEPEKYYWKDTEEPFTTVTVGKAETSKEFRMELRTKKWWLAIPSKYKIIMENADFKGDFYYNPDKGFNNKFVSFTSITVNDKPYTLYSGSHFVKLTKNLNVTIV